MIFKNATVETSLGGPVVKNLLSNAGDTGLISGGGTKIPHATGQLNQHTPTRESPCAASKTQCSLSLKINKQIKIMSQCSETKELAVRPGSGLKT